jgi:hypothetical protein
MKKMIQVVMTLSLLCGASAAMAQSAISQLAVQAGMDAAPLAQQFRSFQDSTQNKPLMIPRNPKDVLGGCMAIDAKALSLVAWTLPQAVGQIQSCLNKTFVDGDAQPRGYTVTAEAARFGVRACPEAQAGQMACQAFMEVEGIKITVSGKILTGDSVLMDLNYSLQKRAAMLLGYHAVLDNKVEIQH